jgi:hypothetical protein
MTTEQIGQLDLTWDMDEGFFGKLREGSFDRELHQKFILILRSITFEENELIPRRVISLLWYIPLFMDWQRERVEKSIAQPEYDNIKTEIENELTRILGIP